MSSLVKYNPAIDGLRAISVLAVVIFHINKSWMPGGFLGVDIFFTISGFLITSILYKEKSNGTFTYRNFYRRRINRILPAYLFVLAVTLIAAYIIVLPYDFYKIGISAASSIFFASNFNYALRKGDYFSSDAEQWPLLHTWSLGVEEQFYIFWPLIVALLFYLCFKFKICHRSALVWLIMPLIIFTAVLATLVAADTGTSQWSYYMFITRANEFLIGAAVAIIVIKSEKFKLSQAISTIALVSLLICLFVFNRNIIFPGVSALIPCICAAILLAPSDGNNLAYRILSTKILVAIGLISYSVYLWHWPTIALTKYVLDFGGGDEFSFGAVGVIGIILITVVMAKFSYHFIEKPVQRVKCSFRQSFVYVYLVPSIVLLTLSGIILYTNGLPERFWNKNLDPALAFYHIDKTKCPALVNLGCDGKFTELSSVKAKFLLVGNSHAEHYYEIVSLLGEALGIQVDLASAGGCSLRSTKNKCLLVRDYVYQNLDKYDGIIYAQKWGAGHFAEKTSSFTAMDKFFGRLQTSGKPIAVLGRIHGYNLSVSKLYNYQRLLGGGSDKGLEIEKDNAYMEANRLLRNYASSRDLTYIGIEALLERIGKPLGVTDNLGRPNYLDSHHLSVYGGKRIAQILLENYDHDHLREFFFPSSKNQLAPQIAQTS